MKIKPPGIPPPPDSSYPPECHKRAFGLLLTTTLQLRIAYGFILLYCLLPMVSIAYCLWFQLPIAYECTVYIYRLLLVVSGACHLQELCVWNI